ncbi:ASCH domain-containing protein [Oceanicola sp. S124]|uniref:ASCH domain-containing protein n=1 Tax=Oceanicola sp. S124 TaxID=1042378 RepID=UPI000255A192
MSTADQITFTFGDSEALCTELLDLVRSGAKTATCGALRDFGEGGEALPQVGRRDIALSWDGTPALEIETLEVFTCRFDEVNEDFALAEGEDDSLAAWQAGHRAYFNRNGGWSPDLMLVCERFRMTRDLTESARTGGDQAGPDQKDGDADAPLPPREPRA